MSYIYVCHFSNGAIKVGKSINPSNRIAEHQNRVYCVGIDLTESKIFKCKRNEHICESELILKCIKNSSERRKNEWFFGIYFSDACGWAEEISNREILIIEDVKQYPLQEIPPDIYQRYVCIESCQKSNNWVAKWKDNEPDKYHWEQGVMRWHLRPDDWFLIWPELITHPCSYLFAKKHPHREGKPKFSDWVLSWIHKDNAKQILDSLPIELSKECIRIVEAA